MIFDEDIMTEIFQEEEPQLKRSKSLSDLWKNTWDIQPYAFDEEKWKNRFLR